MKKTAKKNLISHFADWVSAIFSPFILIFVFLLIVFLQTHYTYERLSVIVAITLGAGLVPIVGTYALLKLTGRISDWDVRKRQERHLLNFTALFFGLVMWRLLLFNQFNFLAHFCAILLGWFFLHTLITLFWKISAHTGTVTLFTLLLAQLISIPWWWGGVIILAVVWSRIYRKNHTTAQAIAGVVLAILTFWLVSSW